MTSTGNFSQSESQVKPFGEKSKEAAMGQLDDTREIDMNKLNIDLYFGGATGSALRS
jgi:hypothetical protein